MEELLNKLIEKGWKPFDYTSKILDTHYFEGLARIVFICEVGGHECCVRELVSKESGLWQFVCENKLYPKNRGHKRENDLGNGEIYYEDERQYYVIESALCDEDKLEEFLLENIKVE